MLCCHFLLPLGFQDDTLDFSITADYTHNHDRWPYHIGMIITTSTDGDSLVVPIGDLINQFNLGSKLAGITSDSGTNLEICKAFLEINFDNTGVFDLEKPMSLMHYLADVLSNYCR